MQNKGGIESVVSICNAKLRKGLVPGGIESVVSILVLRKEKGLVPGGIESVVSNCNAKKKAMGQAALSP